MFNDKPLIHVGILGMKWGRRMDRSGNVSTLRRGKRVPVMVKVRGKKVQLNGRRLSNKTRAATQKLVANIKAKKAAALLKEQNAQEVKRLTSHVMTGYLTMNASKWANEAATPKSPSYNEAYSDWLLNG